MRYAQLYIGLAITNVAVSFVTAADQAIPTRASIVVVPSRFDKFLNQTGDVKVTFRDNHTELWTRRGGCRDARVFSLHALCVVLGALGAFWVSIRSTD